MKDNTINPWFEVNSSCSILVKAVPAGAYQLIVTASSEDKVNYSGEIRKEITITIAQKI